MASSSPGDLLVQLATRAQGALILCAPFAKAGVIARVLEHLQPGTVPELFTRWRVEEVASGVSDTEVLRLIQARGGTVWLHDALHAKYFRSDSELLLGSANLTAKALSWTQGANLELLVWADLPLVAALEERLREESVAATPEIAARVNAEADLFSCASVEPIIDTENPREWLPALREPNDLYKAYKQGVASLSRTSSEAARLDLSYLDIPIGLDEASFNVVVANRLRHSAIVQRVDSFIAVPRGFGQVKRLLQEHLDLDSHTAENSWQVLMRWLREFLPLEYEYRVDRHSELFARRQEDS